MRWVAVGAVLAGLAMPAAAQAQGVFAIDIGIAARGVRHLHEVNLPVAASGRLSVVFRGDPATGCAKEGLCDISGTVTWTPGRIGQLGLLDFVLRGHRRVQGALFVESGAPGGEGTAVRASVDRGTAGSCADAGLGQGQIFNVSGSAHSVGFGLAGRYVDLVGTRCAGPVQADIEHALPMQRVSTKALERGRMTVDLTGNRPFATHGLSGTVVSSIRLRIGSPLRQRSVPEELRPPRHRTPRERFASVNFSVTSVAGRIAVPFAASPDQDVCAALDACGLTGTETLFPSSHAGSASLSAIAPVRRPRRDLLAALGLSRSGNPAGIPVYGSVDWRPGAGTASESLTRSGGTACSDNVRLGDLSLTLSRRGRQVEAAVNSPDQAGGPDPLRTRCPGPATSDVVGSQGLATGTLPLSAFGSHTVAIHLDKGTTAPGQLFSGGSEPDVTVVLRRHGGVHEQTFAAGSPVK